jgi:dihydroorotate dehydrogenase (fumarate)
MHSLFEEQITREQLGTIHEMEVHAGSFAEALSYFPEPDAFVLGPEQYLDHIRRIKLAVSVPVIASLNGVTLGGWLDFALRIQEAGADALELNVYMLAARTWEAGPVIERRILEIVHDVKVALRIPVAVKISPFFSSLGHFAAQIDGRGADGLILFNRFYQPDIDPEELNVVPSLHLSDSSELLLRLRWLAILSGRLKCSLAVSGGVHSGLDAVKALMTGADAVQMVSALLRRGPEYLNTVRQEVVEFMEEHEYASLAQLRGSMSLAKCPDPAAFERANYTRVLQSWRPETFPGEGT